MLHRQRLLTAALSLLIGVVASKVFTSAMVPTLAGNKPDVSLRSNGDQRFWNWDFYASQSRSGQEYCQDGPPLNKKRVPGVEYPITFVFTGYATVDKIRSLLPATYSQLGSDACMMFTTKGGHRIPAMSKGFKTDECSFPGLQPRTYDFHIRLYGPQNERDPRYRLLYSRRWGHWVLGAVHVDQGDCQVFFPNPDTHYPDTPAVVQEFVLDFGAYAGCAVKPHAINLHNQWQGGTASHKIISNGWAVRVTVPRHLLREPLSAPGTRVCHP